MRDFGVERRFFFESRKQFAHGPWIEQRAGEAVLADLASLFEDVNIFFAELRVGILALCSSIKLRESQSTGHACRAAADDDDVGRHLRPFDAG